MSKEIDFFIYLLEQYAGDKGLPTRDVLHRWNECGVTQEILDMYEMYHSEAIENAYRDIDSLLETGSHIL